MEEDTSGFYKLETQANEPNLLFGPNGVSNASYELHRALHETYAYPIDGWYWFDSEIEAKTFFNLPLET